MTPYYEDDHVTIIHGDCRDVLPSLGTARFGISVTSPPYNMGLTPGGNGRGLYKHSTQKASRFGAGYDASSDDLAPDEYASFHRWDHPAPFPLIVPARCIAATGATSVLDPFMGSGSTLRAAKDAGVRAVGIELSERYCEIAAKRMNQEVLDFASG